MQKKEDEGKNSKNLRPRPKKYECGLHFAVHIFSCLNWSASTSAVICRVQKYLIITFHLNSLRLFIKCASLETTLQVFNDISVLISAFHEWSFF